MAGGRSLERELLIGGLLVAVVAIVVLIALLLLVPGPADPAKVEPAALDVVHVEPGTAPVAAPAAVERTPRPLPADEEGENPDLPRPVDPVQAATVASDEANPTVTGRVHLEDGSPVGGARVVVLRGRQQLGEGSSEASGDFSVGPFAAGHLRLTVSHPDYSEVTLRFAQVPAGAIDVVLKQGGSVEGKVIDERTGEPVPNASVRTGTAGAVPDPGVGVHGVMDRGTHTDATGTFRLEGLPVGSVTLVASASSYAVSNPETVRIDPGGRIGGLVLKLQKEGVVEGRVVDDTDGKPIARAMVVFRPPFPAGARRARTGADGKFQIKGITPGTVSIEVSRTGYMTRWVSGLQVAAGESVAGIEVRLQRPGGELQTSDGAGGSGPRGMVHESPKVQYAGIGARLSRADGGVRIESTFPDSPAALAGLQQGDTILEVDGRAISAMDLGQVTELIKGQEGRMVSLLVRRADGTTSFVQPVRQLLNL